MSDDVNGFVTRLCTGWRLDYYGRFRLGSCLAILLEIPRFLFNFPG